jgi:hypothetical protein
LVPATSILLRTYRFIETQSHADFRPDALHAKVICKLRRLLVQLGKCQIAIPSANSLAFWPAQHLVVNGVVDAAIIKLRDSGVPLADALPVILREQIKLANSGVLRRKDFGKQLLENVGNALHLFPGHVALAPFEEHADVSMHDLNMKTDLALRIVSKLLCTDQLHGLIVLTSSGRAVARKGFEGEDGESYERNIKIVLKGR